MKTLITVLVTMMLIASSSINAQSDGQKMGVLGDYHARSMMMDQIVDDPEMRQEMMHKIMQTMDMEKMMNDPDMKARMQKHVAIMQAMLDSDGMGSDIMLKMMEYPEMASML